MFLGALDDAKEESDFYVRIGRESVKINSKVSIYALCIMRKLLGIRQGTLGKLVYNSLFLILI